MIYAGYARTGQEFAVEADVQALGIDAWVARKMEFKRVGKKHRAQPVVSPLLPNYIFIDCAAADYHKLAGVKFLASTLLAIPGKSERYLSRFRAAVEATYAAQEAIAANCGDALPEYEKGAVLTVMSGPFKDQLATFRGLVERAHDIHPKIRATVEVFGQTTLVEFNPMSVRAAE